MRTIGPSKPLVAAFRISISWCSYHTSGAFPLSRTNTDRLGSHCNRIHTGSMPQLVSAPGTCLEDESTACILPHRKDREEQRRAEGTSRGWYDVRELWRGGKQRDAFPCRRCSCISPEWAIGQSDRGLPGLYADPLSNENTHIATWHHSQNAAKMLDAAGFLSSESI